MLRLDFQKGKTLVTLGEFPTTRPRKLRRACKDLRRAIGVGPDVIVEVIVRKAGDLTPAAERIHATAEPVPAPTLSGRWPVSHVVTDSAEGLAAAANVPLDEPTAVELRTYGDLSKFIRDFTGPHSVTVARAGATVKDLVRHLDASSYQTVSAAIHRVGFSLSAKVEFFVAHLEESPAKAIPAEATP